LSLLKGALNERDSWEKAAAAHERSQFPSSKPAIMGRRSKRSSSSAAGGMTPANSADLRVRPLPSRIPQSVPKQVSNLLAWDVVKISSSITVSTSTNVETNFNFNLSQHPQAASWQALFDQWCIPRATVVFDSQYPSGVNFAPTILYTALDFDSTSNINTVTAISDFSTASETQMSEGRRVVRSIRPCVKPQLGSTASSGVAQVWCDCTVSSTPWLGIRSIMIPSSTNYFITATVTLWFAFRNQI